MNTIILISAALVIGFAAGRLRSLKEFAPKPKNGQMPPPDDVIGQP
jgi:hypothetical protein